MKLVFFLNEALMTYFQVDQENVLLNWNWKLGKRKYFGREKRCIAIGGPVSRVIMIRILK